MNEQQTKALRLALEALEKNTKHLLVHFDCHFEAITAIKEALAQDALQALHDENERIGLYEHKPVTWIDADENISDNNDHKCFPIPLYTTPQKQRSCDMQTWVGLTDDEAQWLYDNCRTPSNLIDMTEVKLREINL